MSEKYQADQDTLIMLRAELQLEKRQPIRPLEGISTYVCDTLCHDAAKLETEDGEPKNEKLEAFEEQVQTMCENIEEETLLHLCDKSAVADRRIALLDLHLIQTVIDRHRKPYPEREPQTALERMIARLSAVDGFDWHKMPWSLTGKDYPIHDIRHMFVDPAMRESEEILLIMQYVLENRFSAATDQLIVVAGALSRGRPVTDLLPELDEIIRTLEPAQKIMGLYRLIHGFEEELTKYYPSGAFAADVYLILALAGKGETLTAAKGKINHLVEKYLGQVDPDMTRCLHYVKNGNVLLSSFSDENMYPGVQGRADAIVEQMNKFLATHLAAAIHHTPGQRKTLEGRDPAVKSGLGENTYESMKPRVK